MNRSAPRTPMRRPRSRAAPGSVQSLTRALTLLEILGERPAGCRLKELSSVTGLAPSTAHRLLTTMEEKRFVQFDGAAATWSIGSNCFVAGIGFLRRRHFVAAALPFMHRLSAKLGTSVNLGVLESGELLLLEQVAAFGSKGLLAHPGARLALHASALGKVMLSCAEPERRVDAVARCGSFARITARTIVQGSALAEELRTVRVRGFAVDNEETASEKRCVAAPIYDTDGRCIAALSVTETKSRLNDDQLPAVAAAVIAAAAAITTARDG